MRGFWCLVVLMVCQSWLVSLDCFYRENLESSFYPFTSPHNRVVWQKKDQDFYFAGPLRHASESPSHSFSAPRINYFHHKPEGEFLFFLDPGEHGILSVEEVGLAQSTMPADGEKVYYTYAVQRLRSEKQDILFPLHPLTRPLSTPWISIHLSQKPQAFLSGEAWGLPAPFSFAMPLSLIDLFEAWTPSASTQHDAQAHVHNLPWSVVSTLDGNTLINIPFETQAVMPKARAPIPFCPLFPYPNPHKAHTPQPALRRVPQTYPNMHPAHQSSQFFHSHQACFEHAKQLKKHSKIKGQSLPRTRDSKIS